MKLTFAKYHTPRTLGEGVFGPSEIAPDRLYLQKKY